MKIYTVTHYYDNGEIYAEDIQRYEDVYYYSSLEIAKVFFDSETEDFEGQYVLKEITLDTQECEIIEKTEYNRCSSQWEEDFNNYYEEDEEVW